MKQYLNLNGKSGIEAYEIGDTYVAIKFKKTNKIYTYSYHLAKKHNVDNMKNLAEKGQGLNSYIMKNVRNLYDK
ncbi:MAG: hypothetical protein LBV16_03130 [Elusimicrobiota bacterium]|jgi:hypothetical protein|nr:hypothetical protein [Elusimicrobiota bacterium]